MKFTKKNKELITKVVAIVLAFAAVIGCVALFGSLGEDDEGYKTINPTFSVGAVDKTTGRPIEDECALYTKDIIKCTGIKLYADFDSDIKYTVHFYDDNEVWISCIDNEGLNLTVEDMPEDTYGVRIVIYPQSDENGKISLFERGTYANQLTVKITDKEIKEENTATE